MALCIADFAGEWALVRSIADARAKTTAHLSGRARFRMVDGDLVLEETGTLNLPGQPPMQASRRYRWRQDGARIAVFFDDGRWFHGFDPAAVPCLADHGCPPDHYRVRYDFRCWPHWQAEWEVDGPRKSYRMLSAYRRQGGGLAGGGAVVQKNR